MSELIRFEVKRFPEVRLIGKEVTMSLDSEGNKAAVDLWSRMWQDGSMELLENLSGRLTGEKDRVGWMGDYDLSASTCIYIAGMLTKAGTDVPAGYVCRDLPECLMSIGWIQGREEESDLYAGAHEHLIQVMKEYGYEYDNSADGYEMQYYSFHRFGVPRHLGEKILIMDYCCPCKKLEMKDIGDEAEIVINRSKIRSNFDSLAQRVIHNYKCTYPICLPIEVNRASESSQRQMHEFLQEVINNLYKNPAFLNLPEEKDDFYEDWMVNNSRPELISKMKKIEKSLFEFYEYLYKLGEYGEVKGNKLYVRKDDVRIVKKRLLQLEQLGLFSENLETATIFYSEKYPELFPAWKILCEKRLSSPRVEILSFLYCMYDKSKYSAEHLYGDLAGDSMLIKELEIFFKNKGFLMSFDEYGIHWDKEYQDKQKANAGFSYDYRKRNQMAYSFRVPNFRGVLNHFGEMKTELQELTFLRTKNCDGCGYCTQMDKTGKRMPLTLGLEYNGKKFGKCPLFPNLTWRNIDKKEVENIKNLFDLAETYSTDKRVKVQ